MNATQLPIIVTIEGMKIHFGISKTLAYALAAAGEIESLTMGAPGKHGSRRFLTESVLAYIERRKGASPKLATKAESTATAEE